MKLPPIETSQSSIKMGLEFVSKAYFSAREWSGKFAEKQYQHHYPAESKKKIKFGSAFTNNIMKLSISTQVCGLCQIEKNRMQLEYLCKCHHSYCYSCLNSYAISRIEDLTPVKCPQQQCSEIMMLTSNVYRYLPDSVKLKYLANKNTFTISQQQWANTCQRCLQPKHSGQCKYAISSDLIDNSFKHRECPKCKVEIRLTSGRKKVTCLKCNESLCYLCGVPWANGHKCDEREKIAQMQKQFGHDGCCQCCAHCCEDNCVDCGNCCRRQCGGCYTYTCCDIMFSCKDQPGLGCCLWNVFSIPFRLLLTLLILTFAAFGCLMMLLILSLWVIFCFFGGAFPVACSLVCEEAKHCWQSVLLVLFFPLTFIAGWILAMASTYETPFGICKQFLEMICGMLESNWIELSPTRCLY